MTSCTMPIKDVGELVNALENAGELKRISAQVDPDLEIAEILRRTMYAKGPAILFVIQRQQRLFLITYVPVYWIERHVLYVEKNVIDTPNRVKVMAGRLAEVRSFFRIHQIRIYSKNTDQSSCNSKVRCVLHLSLRQFLS